MMATGHYGGGFLPQDSHFNADQSHGMQSPSKLKSNENSTRPVTIKQILDAEVTPQDITIAIDGIATNEITIVGCITNVKSLETSKLFSLDDGTGSVEAKLWNPTEEYSSFREGIWVRVFGIIKPFNNAKQITITKMRQIVEFNEVTFHNLAVIEAHLMLTRGVTSKRTANQTQQGNYFTNSNQTTSAYESLGNGEFSSPPSAAFGGDVMGQMISQFTPIQRDVFYFYKQFSNTQNGANINDVIRNFRGKYDHKEIIATSHFLVDEGYIYATCDDNHAKCTAF